MNYDCYFFSGHGDGDCGATGQGTTEEIIVKRLTSKIVKILSDNRLKVHTNGSKNNYKENLLNGNSYKYKFGYTLHLNSSSAATAKGIEIIVPAKEGDLKLDFEIINNLNKYFINRGIKSRNYDDELFYTRANGKALNFNDYYKEVRQAWQLGISGGIIELCFISNNEDYTTLIKNEDVICSTIANSILNYCGISNTISSEKVIYYVQIGAFSNRENAEKLANYLTKNNIASIIKAEKR